MARSADGGGRAARAGVDVCGGVRLSAGGGARPARGGARRGGPTGGPDRDAVPHRWRDAAAADGPADARPAHGGGADGITGIGRRAAGRTAPPGRDLKKIHHKDTKSTKKTK